MLLAGGAAAAAVGGTAASDAVSASGTSVTQPDLYGYGGHDLQPSGQQTTLLSVDQVSDTVTETGENAERATAMEISPGTRVDASLDTATVDWFVFEANAGDPVTVEYDRENEVGITGLILYGPDGSFKNKLYVGSGSAHTLTGLAEESGDHFLQVIDVTQGAGEYSFAVWLQEETGDGDEGDDGTGDNDDSDDGDDNDGEDNSDDDDDTDDDSDDGDDGQDTDEEEFVGEDGQQPYQGEPQTVPGRVQAQDFDDGGQGVAYYDNTERNRTGLYRPDEYVDIEESQDSTDEYSVGFVGQGEWLEYTLDVEPGTYELTARAATEWDDRSVAVSLDGDEIATVDVPTTGGWYDWETVSAGAVEIPDSGAATVRVEFVTGGTNLNWLEFEPVDDEDEDEGDGSDDTERIGYGEGPYGGTDA